MPCHQALHMALMALDMFPLTYLDLLLILFKVRISPSQFSDTPYIVWGVSIYQDYPDVCVSFCPVIWIDLDKWIFVKTFKVSLLARHSLVLARSKHMFHHSLYSQYNSRKLYLNKKCLQFKIAFFQKVFNRKYVKFNINILINVQNRFL